MLQAVQSESWDSRYIPTLIELLLHERLGSAWMNTANDMVVFAATLPTRKVVECGSYEVVHWHNIQTVLLHDSERDVTRFVVYNELAEPEAVLELDSSQSKSQFIVVYRATDTYPEPGSLLQTR